MKIISFCLLFNPGATTLIVHIESNSHRKYSVGLERGSCKQVCSNCATCDTPSKFLLYFEYQPK